MRGSDLDEESATPVQTVKLNEGTGELCEAPPAADSFQRQDRTNELADVLIATLLADAVGVDTETALENRADAVEGRYE